jgi:alpha-ketoglutarate-dependent 2,4-dichlorophenoxyacetate dioxygenase
MAVTVRPLKPGLSLAAEVTGIDLRQPPSDADFGAIQDAFDTYAVLVLPGQDVDDDQQIAFSERFGALEQALAQDQYGGVTRREITRLSNIAEDGSIMPRDSEKARYHRGNQLWHTDSSFKPVPANASILSGREVPPVGGETEFADMRAAYDAWPGSMSGVTKAELDGLVAVHSIVYSRSLIVGDIFDAAFKARMPPVRQALVRTHPRSGRKIFYVGSHCHYIEGWSVERSRALIQELNSWGTRPEFVYVHKWRPKDIVMWDNRAVLHRGNPWPDEAYRRVMHRTTVAGDGPTAMALAAE